MRLAAIDIGTNSVHMIVARVRPDFSFEIIDREKEMVRLGAGGLDGKKLTPEAIAAALQALSKFARLARSHDVDRFLAVATSATREAENGGAFLRAIERKTGIRPRIITGTEEARLIHLAAVYGVDTPKPAVVIDVADSASRNPDYRLTPADVARFEKRHGRIAPGTIVLLRTGWDVRWPGRKAYFGDDTPGDASHLHFPSYGAEAARLLVEERKVAAIGVDVASIDYGPSVDFEVHRIAAAAGVPGFENLRGLEQVPARGAWVVALPALIRNGSGGPLRAIAIVPASR